MKKNVDFGHIFPGNSPILSIKKFDPLGQKIFQKSSPNTWKYGEKTLLRNIESGRGLSILYEDA